MSDHPMVQPGSVWANGTLYRVVRLDGEHGVIVEEIDHLDDGPRPLGSQRRIHVAFLDDGLFMGRCIREAPVSEPGGE